MPRTRRQKWALWALGVYVAAAGVLLLSPVGPGRILDALVTWFREDLGLHCFRQGWIEAPANVALFMPLGFLLTMLFRRAWVGVLLAVLLSVSVELAQVVLPARLPSARDIAANALGALVGAALAWLVLTLRRRRLHDHSDLPG